MSKTKFSLFVHSGWKNGLIQMQGTDTSQNTWHLTVFDMAHKRRLCVLKGHRKLCSEISADLVHSRGSTAVYSLHGHELCSPKI